MSIGLLPCFVHLAVGRGASIVFPYPARLRFDDRKPLPSAFADCLGRQ
jgi:hypothetical protein